MRIGMVGARFAGLDGVSLESAKLAEALVRGGHETAWFAGEIGDGFEPATICPAAAFDTDVNREIERQAFGGDDPEFVRAAVEEVAHEIADALGGFIDANHVEAVIVENAWAIPMHLPLAVAIARVVDARSIPTVGHHHDFAWERDRFSDCVAPDLIEEFFPPALDNVTHVVINSLAQQDLLHRRGLESLVLPNVMDFESGPPGGDGGEKFRLVAGLSASDTVLLQPTRVIPRKGIEFTIDLASRMDGAPVVVVTHPDDLDGEYWKRLTDDATTLGVDLRIVDAGRDLPALASAYAAADLVCFPSLYEGYGNALVEAVYHRRPVLVNRYSVYSCDIAPLGFSFLEIEGTVTDDAVDAANRIVDTSLDVGAIVDRNFAIAEASLSYRTARDVIDRSFARIMP